MKIVAVLYSGGEIAKRTPTLLGSAENALGLREFLAGKGHEFIVLTDKEAELDKHSLFNRYYNNDSFLAGLSYKGKNFASTQTKAVAEITTCSRDYVC
jgi:hypothetical protein